MAGPPPFEDIGKKAHELLEKDYFFDQMFALNLSSSLSNSNGLSFTVAGIKTPQTFIAGVHTLYKRGNTEVDVKADTNSAVFTVVNVNNLWPFSKADFSCISTDEYSWKLHVQHLHRYAAIDSSIILNPSLEMEFAATIGNKEFCVGGEIGYEASTKSCHKYTAAIGYNQPDFSAAVLLKYKGKAITISYIHAINPFTSVAAEMTHGYYYRPNNFFSFGSSHVLDPFSVLKTHINLQGCVRLLYQREWRPKSLITFCGEYDFKAYEAPYKMGFKISLVP